MPPYRRRDLVAAIFAAGEQGQGEDSGQRSVEEVRRVASMVSSLRRGFA
jgi:hypothetical protein